jgi:hypothetical protein
MPGDVNICGLNDATDKKLIIDLNNTHTASSVKIRFESNSADTNYPNHCSWGIKDYYFIIDRCNLFIYLFNKTGKN